MFLHQPLLYAYTELFNLCSVQTMQFHQHLFCGMHRAHAVTLKPQISNSFPSMSGGACVVVCARCVITATPTQLKSQPQRGRVEGSERPLGCVGDPLNLVFDQMQMHVVLPVCVAAAEGREDGAHGESARSLLVRDDHGGYHDLVYHLAPRVKGKCLFCASWISVSRWMFS